MLLFDNKKGSMNFKKAFFVVLIGLAVYSAELLTVKAKCSDAKSPLAALLKSGVDNGIRTPLILIHGKHGVQDDANADSDNKTWDEFKTRFNNVESGLAKRYSLYFFSILQ